MDATWVEVAGDAATLRIVWLPDDPRLAPSVRYDVARRGVHACVPCPVGCTADAPGVLSIDALFTDGTESRVADVTRAAMPVCGPEPVRSRTIDDEALHELTARLRSRRDAGSGQPGDFTWLPSWIAATSAVLATLLVRGMRRRTFVA